MKTPKSQPSISSIRSASAPSKAPSGVSSLFTRKNAVYAALAGALGGIIAATPACGEPFTFGPETTKTDAGTGGSAGNTVEGGAGGNAGSGATAGSGGLEGGAGTGGSAGAGGSAGCDGVEVTLTDMAEYEYQIREGSCNGPIAQTSLINGGFETGATKLCLNPGTSYYAVIQVRDHNNFNSLVVYIPDDSFITDGKVTTLVSQEPINESTADLLCNATAGWTTCTDVFPSQEGYICEGISEGDAGIPASNAYLLNINP